MLIDSKKSVNLSPAGILEAQNFQRNQLEFQGKCLRLYLEGKGCDGFFYGVTFDDPSEDDFRFPQVSEDGTFKIDIVVDPDTFQFVEGSAVDWVDDERGRGFIVENPRQKAFRGKFFKRESWREKLEKGPAGQKSLNEH